MPYNVCSTSGGSKIGDSPVNCKIEPAIPLILPAEPYQPEDVPPYRDRRRPHLFQQKWYKEYPWLHFDELSQMMFCHQCVAAVQKGAADAPPNNIFAKGGFRNWKKGIERFRVHENSPLHKYTVEFSVEKRRGIQEKLAGIEIIIQSIKYLLAHGMVLKNETLSSLLELRRDDVPLVDSILRNVPFTYEDEKEIVSIMAACILRHVCFKVRHLGDFCLIFDKVNTPLGDMIALTVHSILHFNSEQFFLGLYTEQSIINDLPKFLPFENLRYTSYGFANNEFFQGEISKLQPSAMDVPCSSFNLSLLIQECLADMPGIGNCIYIVKELELLLKSTVLCELFQNSTSELKLPVCPKRYVLSFHSISTILHNYSKILNVLQYMKENSPCSFMPEALCNKLLNSDILFYFLMCKVLIYPIENLSNIMENVKSAKGLKEAVDSLMKILCSFKEEKEYDILWNRFKSSCESLKESHAMIEVPSDKETNKKVYFSTIDRILDKFTKIFDNSGFNRLLLLETSLLVNSEEKANEKIIEEALDLYNINAESFSMEKTMLINTLGKDISKMDWYEIAAKLKCLKSETVSLFPQIVKVVNLLLVSPVTREMDEKAISRGRALTAFLNDYKSDEMVSDVCVCFIYKDEPGILNISEVAQEFMLSDPARMEVIFKNNVWASHSR